MNHLCPKYLTKNSECQHKEDVNSEDEDVNQKEGEKEKNAEEDLKAISVEIAEKTPKKRKSEAIELEEPKEEKTPKSKRKKNIELEEEKKEIDDKKDIIEDKITGIFGKNDKNIENTLIAVEERLKRFDLRLIKLLAYQRLNDLIKTDNGDIDSKITEIIESSIDKMKLSQYGFNYVPLPSELISREELEKIAKEFDGVVSEGDELQKLRSQSGPVPAPRLSVQMPTIVPTAPVPSLSALPVKAMLCHVERPAK